LIPILPWNVTAVEFSRKLYALSTTRYTLENL
jgi:hypothetical protein